MALSYQQLMAREKKGLNGPKQQARLAEMKAGELAKKPGPGKKQVVNQTGKIKNPQGAVRAEITAEDFNANKNIGYNNPTTNTPFGSQEITYDENGMPVLNQNLSENQQNILGYDEKLSQTGRAMALDQLGGMNSFNPVLSARTGSGDLVADRARYEDEIFQKLTKDWDQDYSNAMEQKKQDLYNRGIPYSADPNSRYQQEINDTQQRFDNQKSDARAYATQLGGDEWSRSFGIGEQLRANQLSEQQGIHNQGYQDIYNLGNMGSGLMLPNFQAYQGYNYNPASPLEAYATVKGVKQNQQQINQNNRPSIGYQPYTPQAPAGPPIGSGPIPGL